MDAFDLTRCTLCGSKLDTDNPDMCGACLGRGHRVAEDGHAYALMLSRLAFVGHRVHEYLKVKGQSFDPDVTGQFDEDDYTTLIECAENLMRNAGRGLK